MDRRTLLARVALGLLLSVGAEARADELVELVKSGNSASLAAVVSLHARFEMALHPNPAVLAKIPVASGRRIVGQYWRSGNKVRIRENETPYGPRDMLQDHDRQQTTVHMPKSKLQTIDTGIIAAEGAIYTPADVWELALCSLPGPAVTFSHLLDTGGKIESAHLSHEPGGELAYLDVSLESPPKTLRCEIWADPSKNYLVRRVVSHVTMEGAAGKGRLEGEVTSFREVKPGVFFPESMELRIFHKGQEINRMVTRLTSIHINEPLPMSVFKMSFPPGTVVSDQVRGTTFRIDQEGKMAGPLGRIVEPPSEVLSGTPLSAEAEASRPFRLVILISCLIAIFATAFLVGRRLMLRKRI